MPRGRKPKPKEIKILNGNPGKRKILDTPEPDRGEVVPSPPEWMEDLAKEEWNRVSPELHGMGLLRVIDSVALEAYCQSYARWRNAEAFVSEHGVTYKMINKSGAEIIMTRPEWYVTQSCLKQIRAFCTEFGLTPSSRCRMNMPGQKDEDDFDVFARGDGSATS